MYGKTGEHASSRADFWQGRRVGGAFLASRGGLFEFDGPVGVVEELFPGAVSSLVDAQAHDGGVSGFDGGVDEFHARLVGSSSAFFDVALDAGADDVVPGGLASLASGDDVVEAEFGGGQVSAAVLASAAVACEDVAPVEGDAGSGHAVVGKQADDAGDRDAEVDGVEPVVFVGFEAFFELGDFKPGFEIVVEVLALVEVDNFR